MRRYIIIFLALSIFKVIVDTTEKVSYITTERPHVVYINKKYLKYFNVTSLRHSRSDPFYYVNIDTYSIYELANNITVDFIFYEFLTNRYKRSFVEMHFKFCDLVQKDRFFGTAMRQGKLAGSCPYPPGEYRLYNMTVPLKYIPSNFPFTKGRILVNSTGTYTKEFIFSGHIDMEIKQIRMNTTIKQN